MDNQTFQRIRDLINQHQTVGVVVKPNPSLDEMAAALGMYLVLKQMGKDVSIACPTDPVVGISSLVAIDKVQKGFSGGGNGDLTVSFPYKEGEIEKVSYTLDNGHLNIQVKAGPQGMNFQQNDVEFKRAGSAPSLLFAIGIAHVADMKPVFDPALSPSTAVVNIDNKADNENYGEVVVVATKFSSVSEQVADFVTLLEPQVELDKDTCQNLLSGILFATNDFTSPSTSYLAFEMAGILMKKGAQRVVAQTSLPNTVANPAAFFPPQIPQPVASMPQPVVNTFVPQQPIMQQPSMPQPVVNTFVPQQPVAPVQQPVMPQQPVQVLQQAPVAPVSQAPQETPADWLAPKVYKGSTVL
ncbi:MAG TPA: hypothetical protein VFQ63_02650 [Patescibacteria group bacterium]|nr:hypothetical protein [Patescibacteria group bacterium]